MFHHVTQSMEDDYFMNADGELLIVPQIGALDIATEFGRIDISPCEIAVIPRGMKFKVGLKDGPARGYVCENYGAKFTLPARGPIAPDLSPIRATSKFRWRPTRRRKQLAA